MRWLAALLSAVMVICFADQSAFADKRVAFIVGNSNYQNVVALANPANDAAAVTEMLKKAAFDVVESRRDLKKCRYAACAARLHREGARRRYRGDLLRRSWHRGGWHQLSGADRRRARARHPASGGRGKCFVYASHSF